MVEKAMAPHSSTLAWKILWAEEPGRLQSTGWRRVGLRDFTDDPVVKNPSAYDEDSVQFLIQEDPTCCGEDNGSPLQYSCLENPMDGGVW